VRSVEPREVFEEGFHIPVMKFMHAGEPDRTLLKLLRAAVRTPDQTEGDLWAQITGLELLEKRLGDLMSEYGLDDLEAFAGDILGRCERAMRAAIARLPDGTYTHSFQTDGLEQPFTYQIAISIKGERILVDYAGTSAQVDRAINCTMTYTFAMTAYAVKCALLPGLPNNEGIFRAIEVTAPEGTIVNPRFPAAVGGRMATGHYLPFAVFGALAPVPEMGYGFGLGFAVRTDAGRCPLPGSVGEYFWGGVLGTSFWIDPVEQLVVVAMMTAPERRLYYRHLLRPLVYGALVGPVPD